MKSKSDWLRLIGILLSLSVVAVGCGDDDDPKPVADAGGDGDSGDGDSGDGDMGDGDMGDGDMGDGDAVTVDQCVDMTFDGLVDGCAECACAAGDAAAMCSKWIAGCDGACWALVNCVGAMCEGTSGADQTACAQDKCADEIQGTIMSGSLANAMMGGESCIRPCAETCSGGDGDSDAGTDDDAGM